MKSRVILIWFFLLFAVCASAYNIGEKGSVSSIFNLQENKDPIGDIITNSNSILIMDSISSPIICRIGNTITVEVEAGIDSLKVTIQGIEPDGTSYQKIQTNNYCIFDSVPEMYVVTVSGYNRVTWYGDLILNGEISGTHYLYAQNLYMNDGMVIKSGTTLIIEIRNQAVMNATCEIQPEGNFVIKKEHYE